MCMWDDCDDYPQVYRSKVQRTRKERKCQECSRAIAVGEPYQNVFMVFDRDASAWITCQHCLMAAQWLQENCGGYLIGGVWEDIHDHIREYRGPSAYRAIIHGLRRLEIGCERKWRRFDGAGLMPLGKVPPVIGEAA